MTTLMRILGMIFLVCVAVVLACGIVASLAHLGYMRAEWSDLAFGWGVAAVMTGLIAFVFLCTVAGWE